MSWANLKPVGLRESNGFLRETDSWDVYVPADGALAPRESLLAGVGEELVNPNDLAMERAGD